MTVTVSQLFAPIVLSATAATIYTVPNTPATITLARGRMRFTNTDTVSHAVTAYAVQSGVGVSSANCFMNAEPVAPNSHLDVDLPMLSLSGFIAALADVAGYVTVFQLDGLLFS